MKKLHSALIIGFIFGFGSLNAFSCTCVLDDLSKRFRKADAVFVGEIYEYEAEEVPKIQNYKEGLPVLLVNKSWKGIKKELVAIDFGDFPKSSGTCPIFYKFEEDKEYLVFAYGKT